MPNLTEQKQARNFLNQHPVLEAYNMHILIAMNSHEFRIKNIRDSAASRATSVLTGVFALALLGWAGAIIYQERSIFGAAIPGMFATILGYYAIAIGAQSSVTATFNRNRDFLTNINPYNQFYGLPELNVDTANNDDTALMGLISTHSEESLTTLRTKISAITEESDRNQLRQGISQVAPLLAALTTQTGLNDTGRNILLKRIREQMMTFYMNHLQIEELRHLKRNTLAMLAIDTTGVLRKEMVKQTPHRPTNLSKNPNSHHYNSNRGRRRVGPTRHSKL